MTTPAVRDSKVSRVLSIGTTWLLVTAAVVMVGHGEVRATPSDAYNVALIGIWVAVTLLVLMLLWRDRDSPRAATVVGMIVIALAAVGLVGGYYLFVFGWERVDRTDLEVWNRTTESVSVVGLEATVEVPACGQISRLGFLTNRMKILGSDGRVILARWGGARMGPVLPLMVTSRPLAEGYGLVTHAITPLPQCEGPAGSGPPTTLDATTAVATCAGATYAFCARDVEHALSRDWPVFAICEYGGGAGGVVPIAPGADPDAECSGKGLVPASTVFKVVEAPRLVP